MDEQRRYLGGDSDHSILVKGLDFALLEQNKARLASTSSKQDDEALEEVFVQKASAPTSTKRSRADIIKDLKEKRANAGESEQPKEEALAEKSTNSSKFRPIGFKPIGTSTEEKVKKKKKKEGIEPKKKKRKVEPSTVNVGEGVGLKGAPTSLHPPVEHAASSYTLTKPVEAETADDFDIFADAGEYKGVEVGSDDDGDDDDDKVSKTDHERPSHPGPSVASTTDVTAPPRKGWFDNDEAELEPEPESEASPSKAPAEQPSPIPETRVEAEEEQPARLAPLTSSTMPSIRDFLAMDEAVEKEEKRKVRKEKRKGKNKDS